MSTEVRLRPSRMRASLVAVFGTHARDRPFDVLAHHWILRSRTIVRRFLQSRDGLLIRAVAERHGDVASESGDLGAAHRASLDRATQLGIRASPQIDQAREVESLTWLPWCVTRCRRRLVVRTDFLADIAPVDMGADRRTMRL